MHTLIIEYHIAPHSIILYHIISYSVAQYIAHVLGCTWMHLDASDDRFYHSRHRMDIECDVLRQVFYAF